MKKITLIVLLFFMPQVVFANPLLDLFEFFDIPMPTESDPGTPPPFCGVGWGPLPLDTDLALIGSRAFLLGVEDLTIRPEIEFGGEVIRKARADKKLILKPGQIKAVQNLGWAGATATDEVALYPWSIFIDNIGANNWNRRWDHCRDVKYIPYITHPKIVLHLGGNDLGDFYKSMEELEGIYILIQKLQDLINPINLLRRLVGEGRPYGFNEMFWLWGFEVKEDNIVQAMYSLTEKMLNQTNSQLDSAYQVLLVGAGPVFSNEMYEYLQDFDVKKFVRLNTYLRRLNDKYEHRLVPDLRGRHGYYRIHYMDMFNVYAGNIFNGAGYYFQSVPADGIHFSAEGNEQFGRMLAAKMALIGWFERNPALDDTKLNKILIGIPVDLGGGGGTGGGVTCDSGCLLALCFFFGIFSF